MKHVLITGATSGIGKQLALDYQQLQWQVTACGRNAKKLSVLPQKNLHTLCFDLDDEAQIYTAGQQVSQPIDLLILNAGTCEYLAQARHFDAQLFARVIQTNLLAVAHCLAAFLPHIPQQGQVALMGSSARWFPFTQAQAYGASKAGLAYLAQSLHVDLKAEHITVSLIEPGFVATPLTDKNTFKMPGCISTQQASKLIRRGLVKRKLHICPPQGFTLLLRLLGRLPYRWQQYLAQQMVAL